MANKTINVIGKVKTNKNGTNYVDTAEGRVFLGKTSGFQAGDEIMGEAICHESTVTYPAVAARPASGTIPAQAAQLERTETVYLCDNFISEEMQAAQLEAKARKAKANLKIAIVGRQTAEVASMETAELWAVVG